MCGIAGIAGREAGAEGPAVAARMAREIAHRGPDDEGVWSDASVALAARRLSIIDLDGGHQPMATDGGTAIAFNGEIYNYRALREGLERSGVRFRSRSDTEVVLRLFERDGIGCLDRVEGMFGIALYESRTETLHLARDRLGKKPLYYGWDGDRFLFASELKALVAVWRGPRELDRQAIHDFLTLRYVPGPATIWAGIRKLEPGHRLRLDVQSGRTEVERWWGLDFLSAEVDPDRDYAGEFERLFLQAVEKRLVAADVPVGVLLSGGIDSSCVAAAAVELGHRDFHTFSVGFEDGGRFNELPFARLAAERAGSVHHELTVDRGQFLDFLPELIHHTDEPLADLASVPLHFVSRLAREHVKVVLSGEGADEVLAGYDIENLAASLDRVGRFSRFVPGALVGAAARLRRTPRLTALARGGVAGMLGELPAHMTHVFSEAEKEKLWGSTEGLRDTDNLIRSWYAECPSAEPVDQLQQVYCRSWLVEDLLMKADKMTMATSLELRVPFLDHGLVEFASRLPLAWKVGDRRSGWRSKRILREFARDRVPAEVLQRPKQGFPVPAHEWLRGETGDWAAGRLGDTSGPLAQLFDLRPLEGVAGAARAGDTNAAHKVWNMIVLDEWLRRWT